MKNDFKAMINKLDIRFFSRIPVIHQTEASECGLASLAMICNWFGKSVNMVELRQQFNLSSRGATLGGVRSIAAELGLSTRALSLDMEELDQLKTPCILHWDFNHFVVLVKTGRKQCVIHDPARGRMVYTRKEISTHFTGVALEVWPGNHFKMVKPRTQIHLRTFINGVHGVKSALFKIFCLSLVIEAITLLLPIGTQLVMDHVIPALDRGLLALICCGLFFFILLRAAVSMARAWSSLVMGTLMEAQWKAGLFSHLMRLPLVYFERRRLGDIQSRFKSLDELRTTFTTSAVGAIMDAIMVLGVSIMLWLYGGYLFWVVMAFTAIYVAIRLFTYGYYRQLSEESLVSEARANSYFMETLYGITTVKIQAMAARRGNHWFNLIVDRINVGIKLKKLDMLFGGLNVFITACDQIVILWLGASMIIDNHLTLGMFVAFNSFREQFSDRIASLVNFSLQLRMMSLHNERVSDIALNDAEESKPDIPHAPDMQPLALETRDLSYRYDSHSAPVFNNLSMRVAQGESVAIIGPSGVGKTTLVKVLSGLFQPESGMVMVNGTDIKQMGVNNYQKMIACVMQEDKLFSGSLRDNICGFSEEIDEAWMTECAKASHIHDTIMAMPMGYETLIGELGEGLSGGQKQRIFIARAIYRKPGIIFMDEATSNLDTESEQIVNHAIGQMQITRVIIAHRESTISSADRIIDLSQQQPTQLA